MNRNAKKPNSTPDRHGWQMYLLSVPCLPNIWKFENTKLRIGYDGAPLRSSGVSCRSNKMIYLRLIKNRALTSGKSNFVKESLVIYESGASATYHRTGADCGGISSTGTALTKRAFCLICVRLFVTNIFLFLNNLLHFSARSYHNHHIFDSMLVHLHFAIYHLY